MARFVGRYQYGFAVELHGGVLTLMDFGRPGAPSGRDTTVSTPLIAISPSRFVGTDGPIPWMLEFTFKDGKASSFVVPAYAFTAKRIDRAP